MQIQVHSIGSLIHALIKAGRYENALARRVGDVLRHNRGAVFRSLVRERDFRW